MTHDQQRKLAAILAADIAGYSALMGADDEGTVRDLKGHQSVVLPMIGEFGGRIIDTAGDGILAEFASVLKAVNCAVAVQKTMAGRNATVAPTRRMQFRIGINLGDIVYDETRVYGDGVNIAARLESIAEPGGICVSDKVYQEMRGKIDVPSRDLGPRTLKNISEPARVYCIDVIGLPGPLTALDSAPKELAPGLPDKPSIDSERRPITILHCRVGGLMSLSTRVEPEDLGDALAAYHGCIRDIVGRHKGHVAKSGGDEVQAYFGYLQADEDDAERAVQAGLAIAAAVDALKVKVLPERLQVSVGIATGLVVVSGDIAAPTVGETPFLASSLLAITPPGKVVISAGTRRLIGKLFDCRRIESGAGRGIRGFAAGRCRKPFRSARPVGQRVACRTRRGTRPADKTVGADPARIGPRRSRGGRAGHRQVATRAGPARSHRTGTDADCVSLLAASSGQRAASSHRAAHTRERNRAR